MKKPFLMQILLFICFSSSALAQDNTRTSQPIAGKLGFHTFTATTVPAGSLQLDTEFSYFRNNGRYIYITSANLPRLSLRYGITNGLELNAGTAFSYIDTRFKATRKSCLFCQWQYKKDYVTAGLRATLLRYQQGQGLLTVVGETYIPGTIGEGVRSTFDLVSFRIVNAARINQYWGYTLNAGSGIENGGKSLDYLDFSAATTYDIPDQSLVFLSLSHRLQMNTEKPASTYADAGILHSFGAQFQLQAALGLGLSRNLLTNDISAKIGLAWRPGFLNFNNNIN